VHGWPLVGAAITKGAMAGAAGGEGRAQRTGGNQPERSTELLGHHEDAAETGRATRVASPIRFRC
jgi:hypothetical protein